MKRVRLASVVALTLALFSVTAHAANGGFSFKTVPLVFGRYGNPPASFPNTSSVNGFYITGSLVNGTKGGSGVAVSAWDTTEAIFIGDHYFKQAPALRAASGGVAGSVSPGDTSSTFGILRLRSTTSSIDTVKVAKDISLDGVVWTATDSISASLITGISGTITVQPIAGDSCSVKLSGITNPDGVTTAGAGAIYFFCNPFGTSNGVTRQALQDIQYVRFRVWMTPGDAAAAGLNGGVYGSFQYPVSPENLYSGK